MSLILASKSPRRAELLRQVGVEFQVLAAEIDETQEPGESPDIYVQRMARTKALTGLERARKHSMTLPVLAADTVVVFEQRVFGKPLNRNHGIEMLRQLSGHPHQVMSAVFLATEQKQQAAMAVTDVFFRELSDDLLQRYWQFDEPGDKAGGYAIQGLGAIFVEKIVGSYSNVVGLPIETLVPLLENFDIPYWLGASDKQ